jgi:hypothetical protein
MTNHLIERRRRRAGRCISRIDIGREEKPTSVNMGRHYEDIYVKTAEGWRIKSRNSSVRNRRNGRGRGRRETPREERKDVGGAFRRCRALKARPTRGDSYASVSAGAIALGAVTCGARKGQDECASANRGEPSRQGSRLSVS